MTGGAFTHSDEGDSRTCSPLLMGIGKLLNGTAEVEWPAQCHRREDLPHVCSIPTVCVAHAEGAVQVHGVAKPTLYPTAKLHRT